MPENKKLIYKTLEDIRLYEAIMPNIEVDDGNGYVWFNSDNNTRDNAYPNKLLDLYLNGSTVHSNFINLKGNLMYGSQGLIPLNANDAALAEYIKQENGAGDNLDEIFKRMCYDYALFEAAAIQIIYDGYGKIAEMYYTCPLFLRAAKFNSYGYCDTFLYNDQWGIVSNKRTRKPQNMVANSIPIKAYNPRTAIEDKRQILYIRKRSHGHGIYGIPSYHASLPWVQLDYELGQFHLYKVMNSFSASAIVTMYGAPTEEERNGFVSTFKDKHTGSQNAGKLTFNWIDGEGQAPVFTRLEGDINDGLFEELNLIVTQKIATAHGASLELAGVSEAGASLGGDANKLFVSRTSFIDSVIEPMQDIVLAGINRLLKVNGYGEASVVNDPLKITQPRLLDTDTTEDERRMMLLGFGPKISGVGSPASSGATPAVSQEAAIINEALKKLSGREFQGMERIKRKFEKKSITKDVAAMMLKSGFGVTDEFIEAFLSPIVDEDNVDELNQVA